MGKRRHARELALQVLFHLEFSADDPENAFDKICEHFKSSGVVEAFSKELVVGVWKNRALLDRIIRQASRNWRLERMSKVDRNILRIGTYELLFLEDVPAKVSIDEAVELGKRYGTEDSWAFINGVLDHVFSDPKAVEEAKREYQAQ